MTPDYEGYEALNTFSPQGLVEYRRSLLAKSKHQVEFIRKHVPDFGSVVEVGAGNGRLLVGLAPFINWGWGIEMSSSRTTFAQDWLQRSGINKISWSCANITELYPRYETKLAVCITGCFQYFWGTGEAEHVLKFMRASKYALFELYKLPDNLKGWHKLPITDPFSYLLDEYIPEGDQLYRHVKTFIRRDGKVDSKEECLYYYGKYEFLSLLSKCGFTKLLWDVEDHTKRVVLVG